MCDTVAVRRGDAVAVARTKGQLRAALGVEPVQSLPNFSGTWLDADCLCPCAVVGLWLECALFHYHLYQKPGTFFW